MPELFVNDLSYFGDVCASDSFVLFPFLAADAPSGCGYMALASRVRKLTTVRFNIYSTAERGRDATII